jgi:uncharacterized protein
VGQALPPASEFFSNLIHPTYRVCAGGECHLLNYYQAHLDMKQLIEDIAKALVDLPDEVSVKEVTGEQVTVLELRVAPTDLGKVIGKQGRTARSIRTLLGAAGMKLNRRFTLEILE